MTKSRADKLPRFLFNADSTDLAEAIKLIQEAEASEAVALAFIEDKGLLEEFRKTEEA